LLICPALGHLYAVGSKDPSRRMYPVWDFTWKPKYDLEKRCASQREWLRAIQELAKDADRFINACDYDIEGSLIGYMILKNACDGADRKAARMRYSTLTRSDLKDAYLNLIPELDYQLIHAGMCRHEVDWLYGINLSRALTESVRECSNRYVTLSTGRVQSPTLRFIVEREVEIHNHVSKPYWTIDAEVEMNGVLIQAEYAKRRFEGKPEAESVVKEVVDKSGYITEIQQKQVRTMAPHPFDLTTMQSEAYKNFHFGPSQTLRVLEKLYLKAIVSYPRTSSQKLPPSIDYRRILEGLRKKPEYRGLSSELLSEPALKPSEGDKTDPAHPAIYPTGQLFVVRLERSEKAILDLVVRRFMATFAPAAVRQNQHATLEVEGKHVFHLQGSRVIGEGWMRFYSPYVDVREAVLPPLSKGQIVTIKEISAKEHLTAPPPRYNPSSLLKEMGDNEIGTKATRAAIIDTLYKRGYVTGESMRPTPIGNKITEVLKLHCPEIVDVSFTRDLETQMNSIELGKARHETVIAEAIEELKSIMKQMNTYKNDIGRGLYDAIRNTQLQGITLRVVCPNCGLALRIIRSRRTRKRFIGCSGALRSGCRFSLPLPQSGTIELMDRLCRKCGFQLVIAKGNRGRPFISCPKCYVEGRMEKLEK